jgi:glutamate 5-kinase
LLLTHEDFDSRPRYLNMRNTLAALFEWNAVPIINENDTISVDEIRFGDNDRLAAMVANLLQAPLLVILSVVDGLYATDPGAGGGRGAVIPWSSTWATRPSAWPAPAPAPWAPAACGASSRPPAW